MHEIITLQLGQSSNYLATHFWNIQESYFTYNGEGLINHDVHFRPGIGAEGTETFTPRTLIYDLKGGFGSMRKVNALYESEQENGMPKGLWNGAPVIQHEPPIEQHPYQLSLDEGSQPPELTAETVRYWSDFNRVFYHPRSIIQLNEFELNSTLMPFEKWTVGEELFNNLDKEHDLLDRDLRLFAEESDQLQALQVMTGVDDAWGGFAAQYMERLRDELGKTSIWVWGLENSRQEKHLLKIGNLARSLQSVSSQASLYVPITVPSRELPSYISLNRRSEWHKSALLSTALETMTLPSRLKTSHESRATLTQMEELLNVNGNQRIAELQMSIVDPELQHQQNFNGPEVLTRDPRLPDNMNQANPEDANSASLTMLDMELSPQQEGQLRQRPRKIHTFGRVEMARGMSTRMTLANSNTMLRQRFAGLPVVQRYSSPLRYPGYPLLNSTPNLYWNDKPRSADFTGSLAVQTSLSTTTSIAARIKSVQTTVGRLVGLDEREALSNELGEMREAYENGWNSGSDEDDD